MELRSTRSRSRTPFVQTRLEQETISTEQQHNHSEEVTVQHTYSTRTRSHKSNNSTLSDEVFTSPMSQKSGRVTRRNRHKTSDYSSEDGENEISSSNKTDESSRSRIDTYTVRSNGEVKSALQVYKEAGEYWNKFPKTDYTYSIHSKDRVELAPGVIAMPNMSRRSLRRSTEHNLSNNNHASHTQQSYNDTTTSAGSDTILHQNFKPKALFRGDSYDSFYDETKLHTTTTTAVVKNVSIVRRLYRSVSSVLWTLLARVLTMVSVLYWTSTTAVLWIGRAYYRAVSRVLLFDTWILQGTDSKKRYGILAAIVALPLLLFGGWWLWTTGVQWAIPSLVSTQPTPITPPPTPIKYQITPEQEQQAKQQDQPTIPSHTLDATAKLQIDNIYKHLTTHEQQLTTHEQQLARVQHQVANIQQEIAKNNLRLSAELNRCCRRQYIHVETYVKKILTDLLSANNVQASPDDISTWLRSVFVAQEDLDAKLANVTQHLSAKFEHLVHSSAKAIMNDVAERINVQLREKLALNRNIAVDSGLSDSQVERIVKETLAVYDADKTGLVDYALEPAGGQILSTRCTESYNSRTAVLSVLGIPLWFPSNTPRVVITPGVTPGECWAFQNFPGFLVIQLTARIRVKGFTLEHIPETLAPGGRRDSAPRAFSVWGLQAENDREPQLLGSYEYDLAGPSLQFFPVEDEDGQQVYNMVELRVDSNHGNSHYTCLYRFRVHGMMAADDENTR